MKFECVKCGDIAKINTSSEIFSLSCICMKIKARKIICATLFSFLSRYFVLCLHITFHYSNIFNLFCCLFFKNKTLLLVVDITTIFLSTMYKLFRLSKPDTFAFTVA